uniref:Uncharacterized protein n=1 Tax=Myripristis murdjan TaxID=586833 RepID=A0A667XAP7_9TELE
MHCNTVLVSKGAFQNKSSEQRRRSSHRLVLHYIVPCLNSHGLCVVDRFLGDKTGERVLQEVRSIHHAGKMRDGQLAGSGISDSRNIRGDQIAWVEGNEAGCENIGYLLTRMDKLITCADGRLGRYKIRGRHKVSRALPSNRDAELVPDLSWAAAASWRVELFDELEKNLFIIAGQVETHQKISFCHSYTSPAFY